MPTPITLISSMATRQVLAELTRAYAAQAGCEVALESVGGVDAARRVQAGEAAPRSARRCRWPKWRRGNW